MKCPIGISQGSRELAGLQNAASDLFDKVSVRFLPVSLSIKIKNLTC